MLFLYENNYPDGTFLNQQELIRLSLITHAVNKHFLCDYQFLICWIDRELLYQYASVDPTKAHCAAVKIPFSIPVCLNFGGINLKCCTDCINKLAEIFGSLFVLNTLNHIIFLEKPSIDICIRHQYGFNLSYPSICQVLLGLFDYRNVSPNFGVALHQNGRDHHLSKFPKLWL